MLCQTRKNIFTGLGFVLVGLVYALCDRWQRELKVQGVITRKPHYFDHPFLMWTLKQFLQLSLLPVWKLTEIKSLYFKHRERANQGNYNGRALGPFPPDDLEDVQEERDGNVNRPPVNQVLNHNAAIEPMAERERPIRKCKDRRPSKLMYFPPAFFAQMQILLIYFGLKLTYNSSFIMLKGTVAFFTALLSLAFLAQKLSHYIWCGVVVATLGFAISGLSDYIDSPVGYEKYGIAAGDLLILMAQIMCATKIIYEEKFIRKHSVHPVIFLGAEAVYGTVFAVIFLLVFNLVDAVQYSSLPNGRVEDVVDAALQFSNSWQVKLSVVGALISYILYAYLGMFLIRDLGALPRIMIETFVWSIYWAICLSLKWETFFIAQVPGLCVIAVGALIYSQILVLPLSCAKVKPGNAQGFDGSPQADNHLADETTPLITK